MRAGDALGLLGIAAFYALLFVCSARSLAHDDIFWHLHTGEWVVNAHRVPRADPFTFTVAGQPWTSHEWGFALLLYTVHRLFGFAGLIGLMQLFVLALFALVHGRLARALEGGRAVLALPLLLLGLFAAERSCFVLRAALLTSLALALLATLLERVHASGARRWRIATAVLFLVWANCHAGVTFGLCVLALHFLQALVTRYREAPSPLWRVPFAGEARSRALLTLGCAAVTLVNPNGFDLWTYPFRVNALFYTSGLRWNMGQYRSPPLADYPWFYLLVALCLAACLPLKRLFARLSDASRPALAQALALALFLALALRSNRFILDFVVFAVPFIGYGFGAVEAGWTEQRARLAPPWTQALACLLVVAVAWLARPSWPRTLLASSVPVRLADFMQAGRVRGRMFNYEAAGGYLGWRLHLPVYWDGRNDIFFGVAHEFAYARDFGELVSAHDLDIVVLNPVYQRKFGSYLTHHRAQFGLVYFDDTNALYVKRLPRFGALLARDEYLWLQPFALPRTSELERLAGDQAATAAVEREAQRALRWNPDLFTALYVAGELARQRGDAKTAYRLLDHAVRVNEDPRADYALATVAHALGYDERARELLRRVPVLAAE